MDYRRSDNQHLWRNEAQHRFHATSLVISYSYYGLYLQEYGMRTCEVARARFLKGNERRVESLVEELIKRAE